MHKGFTLIEFVVIISIFAIMAAVALFNFQGFRSNVAINNLSHDIALTLRQAQIFGWSSQTDTGNSIIPIPIIVSNGTGTLQRYANGVYFPYDNNKFENQFLLYTKTDSTSGNEMYVPGISPTIGDSINDTIKIQGDVHIMDIRVGAQSDLALTPNHEIPSSGTDAIGTGAGGVSIAFSRPRPEALFFTSTGFDSLASDQYMAIYIGSNSNPDPLYVDHVVFVSRFGEIEVQ
jgi:prepilin-type N-terminal cleavage/methylation domain-containing protein